jgi:phospholipid/cholesterol/gamma-HCH transport system substrate-binding protein
VTPFRERNPVPIGAAGLTALVLLVVAAFNVEGLPLVGGGEVYRAAFSEAAGLRTDDEVRLAGVKVGTVEEVGLAGDHVRVSFRLEDDSVRLGERTRASIRIKTVLGRKYLALESVGSGELDPERGIPERRTDSPYDVVQAFGDLSTTVGSIDTDKLAGAFDTLSQTFENSPEEVQASIRGLSRLSRTVAKRDEQLHDLLEHANGVSEVLAQRNQQLTTLVRDGDRLLREVHRRREVIHRLLVQTSALSQQLTALVRENEEQVQPALQRLDSVVDVLQENQRNLDRSIEMLAPFVRGFSNVLGNGRWFDTYIQNLVPLPGTVQPPSQNPDVIPESSR